jgi:hypothetical protein
MKIPSLKYVTLKASNTLFRFPFTISVAIIGTIAALYVVDFNYTEFRDYTNWYHLIMTCVIGIPLFISLTVFSERLEVTKFTKFLIRSAGFIFLFLYYITLPHFMLEKHYIRMFLYLLLFHLLVSFSAFIGFRNQHAFWQFNKNLFIRLLVTILYSSVLFIGISLAMLAIDQLFKVDIHEESYFRLWIIIVGVFSIWFFLAGIPKHFKKLDHDKKYLTGIKIFTQFILVPLVGVYAIILYAYFIKVISTWDWPVGWVVYLVSGYALLGIFSFLLLFPIQEETQNKGIRLFSKIFFFSLFPLLVMFFIAIFKRIHEYGITENRYFILLLGVWIAFNAGFIIFSKYKMIRIVPISLALLAILSINGPWNAFKISKWQQQSRLETFLTNNTILKNGKVVKINHKITDEDDVEICSIMTYLADVHGYQSLQPYFTQNLDTLFKRDSVRYYSNYNGIIKLTEIMGIEYNMYNFRENNIYQFTFTNQYEYSDLPLKVSGYDYLINYRTYYYNYNNETKDTTIINTYSLPDSSKVKMEFFPLKGILKISHSDSLLTTLNILDFIKQLENSKKTGNNGYYQVDKKIMTIPADSLNASYRLNFSMLSGKKEKEKFNIINEIQADLLVKVRR